MANVFISHMDREPLLGVSGGGWGADHGMEDMSTFQQLDLINKAHDKFNVEERYCWLDYTSLRPCQKVRQSRAMSFLAFTDAMFCSGV